MSFLIWTDYFGLLTLRWLKTFKMLWASLTDQQRRRNSGKKTNEIIVGHNPTLNSTTTTATTFNNKFVSSREIKSRKHLVLLFFRFCFRLLEIELAHKFWVLAAGREYPAQPRRSCLYLTRRVSCCCRSVDVTGVPDDPHFQPSSPFIILWWKEKKEFWVFLFHRLVPFLLFFSFSKIKSRHITTTWRRTGWYVWMDGWMQEAECEKASMDVKYNMDTKVEDNTRLYKLQKSNFDREINTAVRYLLFQYSFHLIC